MSFAIVAPEVLGAAAADIAGIGSTLSAANAASAARTTAIAAAAGDEVSAAIALLFSGHGQGFQALNAQAAAFHRQFVQAMTAGAGSYAGAEVANASLLKTLEQRVLGWVNAPAEELFGRPLFSVGGGHGAPASAPGTPAVSPTTTADTGGIALVMGPTGFPQPSAAFVATVDRLYLQPLGFHGHAESLYTPELGYNTDANLPLDVNDLTAAVNAQIATGNVSAQNPIWVFGYSQSAAAASEAMAQLHAEGVPSSDLHFVLVGDPASATGGILNTLLPSLGPLGDQIKPLLSLFDLSQTMGLTTPNYYPADVYTLTGDGYAAWPQNFYSNPIADIHAVSGFFSTHEEYLGLTPGQIQGATPTYTDGMVQYYTIDNNGRLLPTLINAAVNMGWI
jgi:hypothetical protein